VEFDGPSVFVQGIGTFAAALLGGADAPLPFQLGPNRWAIGPQDHAVLLLRVEHSVEDWLAGDGHEDEIRLRVTTQQATAVTDCWTFTVWARPLERSDVNAGLVHQTVARQPYVPDAFMRVTTSGPARRYEA
jgi:hypothetical protein